MEKKIIIFFIALAITVAVFAGPFSKLRELKMRNRLLAAEVEHLKRVNAKLQDEKKRLEEDLTYVEERAREKMGIVKEGEIIYKIVPEEQ